MTRTAQEPTGDAQLDNATQRNVETIARMERTVEQQRTAAERIADGVSAAIGSWPFIITQTLLLVAWLALNAVRHTWDPYPFILLNLMLSFQAAYASPIIMMSQNRQGRMAARRNHLDLQINLLAEQEATEILRLLRTLCERSGINSQHAAVAPGLEEATRPEAVVREIKERVENRTPPA